MTNLRRKIFIGIGILILILDILLMHLWVRDIKPDLFMSGGPEIYILEIFGVNIILAIIAFFYRKKLSILFSANTIICYWIFLFFWNSWIDDHPYSYKEYTFKIENRQFKLSIEKNPNLFGIDEIITDSRDSLITIGMHEKSGDSLKLTSKNEIMHFYGNKLIGFSLDPKQIKLTKID